MSNGPRQTLPQLSLGKRKPKREKGNQMSIIVKALGLGAIVFIATHLPETTPVKSETSTSATKAETPFNWEQMYGYASLVRAFGYDCNYPLNLRYGLTGGLVIKCEGRIKTNIYWYNIEDRGGNFFVEAK